MNNMYLPGVHPPPPPPPQFMAWVSQLTASQGQSFVSDASSTVGPWSSSLPPVLAADDVIDPALCSQPFRDEQDMTKRQKLENLMHVVEGLKGELETVKRKLEEQTETTSKRYKLGGPLNELDAEQKIIRSELTVSCILTEYMRIYSYICKANGPPHHERTHRLDTSEPDNRNEA